MSDYLSYQFNDTPEFVATFDELPLWSAPFGLLLLKHLELRPHLTVVDIGSGAGFPALELAARLGNSCRVFGVDPWANANARARQKIADYRLSNVEIIEGPAAQMPFADASTDLIVSNLGINNFDDPPVVFRECHRILKPGGRLALTTNLNGHWAEFYQIFYTTLRQLGKTPFIDGLQQEEAHRGTIETVAQLFTGSGFRMTRIVEEPFEMKFLDGSAFLNHHFIQLGWLGNWMGLFPKEELTEIFYTLEQNLNAHAARSGGLVLTVPAAFVEGEKI